MIVIRRGCYLTCSRLVERSITLSGEMLSFSQEQGRHQIRILGMDGGHQGCRKYTGGGFYKRHSLYKSQRALAAFRCQTDSNTATVRHLSMRIAAC
ncbi:uncharacterized protein BT62DRAFT_381902 [Guyanagaster necrorhizus]|uniref:Uncharacterized protein n=1 Tax=Guyanagaster necrorhizus TaxID=856835 RepID=A0A9P7VKR5_9AGAR|nr:uncharacterized protein BT62DRAFT_381902 [Guyanagaster necrorhizus MCA 3950]KAG7442427.1 hypothetical protein BT62DRAFT_381902 [Guyanagaster necrorhizus MCA 3950]